MDANHSSPHDVADVASWQSVAACPGGLWKIQLRRKHRQMLKSDCRDVEDFSFTCCPRLGSLCQVRVRLKADVEESDSSVSHFENAEQSFTEVPASAEVAIFPRRQDSVLQLPLDKWVTLRLGEGQCDVTEACLENMRAGETSEVLLSHVGNGSNVSPVPSEGHPPLLITIELQTFTPGLESWEMSAGDKWDWVMGHKERGGVRFKSGDVWGAGDSYGRALKLLVTLRVGNTAAGTELQQDLPPADQIRTVKAELYSNLSLCQLKLNQLDRARVCASKATLLEPGVAKAWYRLGQACQNLNDLDGAKRAFRRVLELQPDSSAAQKALKDVASKEKETNAKLGLRLSKMFS